MPGEKKTFPVSQRGTGGSIFHPGIFKDVFLAGCVENEDAQVGLREGNQFVCANESEPGSHQG